MVRYRYCLYAAVAPATNLHSVHGVGRLSQTIYIKEEGGIHVCISCDAFIMCDIGRRFKGVAGHWPTATPRGQRIFEGIRHIGTHSLCLPCPAAEINLRFP
jgi:hypothetical protein